VNLFGFDFEVDEGSENLNGNKFLYSLLERQRSIFSMLLKENRRSDNLLLVNHSNTNPKTETFLDMSVINKSVPSMTRDLIDIAISKNIELQKGMFDRARNGDVQIVAELTNNHLGDTNRLLKMVEECKRQGADAIKIQKRDINFLYTEEERNSYYKSPFGDTLGEYRAGVELTLEQIEYLTIRCAELNIPWFTSVLDSPSLKLIEHFQPVCIKAPSTISNHRNFLKDIANSQIQYIFISTGATNAEFIDWITDNFKSKQIVLMQCTSKYPTPLEECGVNERKNLEEIFKTPFGYSDHTKGLSAAKISIVQGAKVIEKHVNFDLRMFGPDSSSSITFDDLENLVRFRNDFQLINSPYSKDEVSKQLESVKKLFGRSLSLKQDLKAGHILVKDDLTLKKPHGGEFSWNDLDKVIGRKLNKDLSSDVFLTNGDLV
jgi:N-acetylneuraminate synthase